MIFNNIIINWGSYGAVGSLNNSIWITIPHAYKDTKYHLGITYKQTDNGANVSFRENGWKSKSTTGFTYGQQGSGMCSGMNWITIGY